MFFTSLSINPENWLLALKQDKTEATSRLDSGPHTCVLCSMSQPMAVYYFGRTTENGSMRFWTQPLTGQG